MIRLVCRVYERLRYGRIVTWMYVEYEGREVTRLRTRERKRPTVTGTVHYSIRGFGAANVGKRGFQPDLVIYARNDEEVKDVLVSQDDDGFTLNTPQDRYAPRVEE